MSRVDTREPKSRIEPLRRAGWEVATLHYGDYDGYDAIGKLWCIEQKTLAKLLADMRSGVLIRQCRAVIEHSDFPILMVEGHWIQDKNGYLLGTGITWQEAWNQLQTIQDMGCRIQPTTSTTHTVERLFELEAYYKKEKHDSALRQVSGDPYVIVLSQIEGINKEKAKMLEVVLPTLNQIAGASLEELAEVRGIGEVLARRIYNFFHTDYIRKDEELWQ